MVEKQMQTAKYNILTRLSGLHPAMGSQASGGLPWVSLLGLVEQVLLGTVERNVNGWNFHGLEILTMMSLGYEVRTAGSHLPRFRQFRGLWSEKGGSLESQTQKEKSRSFFSLSLERGGLRYSPCA